MKDKSMLWKHPDVQNTFLFRIPKKVRGEWIWRDEFRKPVVDPALTKIKYDQVLLEEYKLLPVKWKTLQVDIVLQPFPIPDKDGKLKYHFMLLGLDPKTEIIVMTQMLKSGERYETILNGIPNLIMNEMIHHGYRPGKFEYRNPDIDLAINFFKDHAGTEIVFKKALEPLGLVIIKLINQIAKGISGYSN